MPKYYLLGGENIHKRDAEEVNQRAFNDAGETPKILVFPWARASFDKTYLKSKLLFDYFRSLGASTVNIVEYSFTLEEIKEKIFESDLVYLTGGVTSVLLERLRKLGVDSLLKDYEGIIVGRSAGALALCKKCVITYIRKYLLYQKVQHLFTITVTYQPSTTSTCSVMARGKSSMKPKKPCCPSQTRLA
jgi:dipeptidase E